jgi:hypothetical protein
MAAVGPGRAADHGAVDCRRCAPGLLGGQLEQVDAQVGARHGEAAGAVFDVGGRSLQRVGRQLLAVSMVRSATPRARPSRR